MANTSEEEYDTLPMFRAAPEVSQSSIDIVYCSKCGCHYSNGKCNNPDHNEFLERRSHK